MIRRIAASSWVAILFIYGLVVGFAETSQPNNHGAQHMIQWGTVANWVGAVTTFILAAVAVVQETIRGWFYHPTFQFSFKAEPPDCVAVPLALHQKPKSNRDANARNPFRCIRVRRCHTS
jgi:hypothetical protein